MTLWIFVWVSRLSMVSNMRAIGVSSLLESILIAMCCFAVTLMIDLTPLYVHSILGKAYDPLFILDTGFIINVLILKHVLDSQ